MTGSRDLLCLLAEGQRLLERERSVILSANFEEVAAIADAKQAFLGQLDLMLPEVQATPDARRALDRLIEAGRRNERLIAGTLRGFRAARRKIEAIMAARRGAVAYAADGSRISSWADGLSESRRA